MIRLLNIFVEYAEKEILPYFVMKFSISLSFSP